MGTLIRSNEAAQILDVSRATLYAYVSRGRLSRTTAADGRTSLFDRDEVERLGARSRRATPGPRATIDVQISSAVTVIAETQLTFRGHDAIDLAASGHFEDVAELLWASDISTVPIDTRWPDLPTADRTALAPIKALPSSPIGRLAIASHVLGQLHPDESSVAASRCLLLATPIVLGSTRRTGPYAHRVAAAWRPHPPAELVTAIDTALMLLADHELATSTLGVRIAASVRATPYVAFAAGLASTEGILHGSASAEAYAFLGECAASDPDRVIAQRRADRQPIPGFGHKVYRNADPRFTPLLDAVRRLDAALGHDITGVVDATVAEVGRVMPHPPNIDLALGALMLTADLDPATPIFAVARIAGWGAHYAEELTERPLRFRGVATPR